jgi:hypothetical protein
MPKKYVAVQPVTVDAARWTGDNESEVAQLTGHRTERNGDVLRVWIDAPAGERPVDVPVGDWVVRDSGTVRILSAGAFAESYEPLHDDEHQPSTEQIANVADTFALEGGLD